jgi:aldose 1-epimerase
MSASSFAPFEFLPLGAIIQSFKIGNTNIVQGFPKQALYPLHNAPFFGETIGRVANRIKNAKIDLLNGKSYQLAVNNGPNSLHGGDVGWGKLIWEGPIAVVAKPIPGLDGAPVEGAESIVFKLTSKDGDEGYPGTVNVSVTYTAATQKTSSGKVANVLAMEYEVELVDGADETAINLTNHSCV